MKLKPFILVFLYNILNAQISEPLSISIVRNDGIIVPIARYQDSTWKKIFNKPESLAVYERYVPEWYFQNNVDGSTHTIRTGVPVNLNYDNQSESTWGYMGNYTFDIFKTPISLRSTVGIATNLPLPQVKVSRLSRTDSKWSQLTQLVRTDAKDDSVALSEVVQLNLDTARIYYVDAGRTIKSDSSCATSLSIIQWVYDNAQTMTSIHRESVIDDCDFKLTSGMEMVPYGGLRLEGKYYFVISSGGWEVADYSLVTISAKGIQTILGEQP